MNLWVSGGSVDALLDHRDAAISQFINAIDVDADDLFAHLSLALFDKSARDDLATREYEPSLFTKSSPKREGY